MPKRRVVIRESDFEKLQKSPKSLRSKKIKNMKFSAFTKDFFEKRITYYALKGKKYLADQYAHFEYPSAMINKFTQFTLYDRKYVNYLMKYNENGELLIRAGLRQPQCRLGYMTYITE